LFDACDHDERHAAIAPVMRLSNSLHALIVNVPRTQGGYAK
jgi:hypothetical protein